MTVVSNRAERLSALTGILAVALWIGGIAIMGTSHVALPGGLPEEDAAAVLQHFRANDDSVISGSWLFMIGALAFIWFAGTLRNRLVIAEGREGTFSVIAFAGGIATGIFVLGMPSGGLIAALGIEQLDASATQALNAVEGVFFLGAELSAIVLVLATSFIALRAEIFTRWWAWAGALLAVWLVVAPIGWVGLLVGLPLWTVGTSLMLWRRGDAPMPAQRLDRLAES